MIEEGLAQVQRAPKMDDSDMRDLSYAHVREGRPEEARKILAILLDRVGSKRVSPTDIAGVYAVLEETDNAIEWLERAYDERSGHLPAVNSDFVFDKVRNDSRFRAIMEKAGITSSNSRTL